MDYYTINAGTIVNTFEPEYLLSYYSKFHINSMPINLLTKLIEHLQLF